MQKMLGIFSATFVLSACGSANLNSILVTKEQKAAVDQLLIDAQYQYDQGNASKALELTGDALKQNPYEEKTLILRAYSYLSLAGLDGFKLSKNLIEQSDAPTTTTTTTTTTTKTGDKTADNLSSLASVIGLSSADLDVLGDQNTKTGTTVYVPKSRTLAREAASEIIQNIDLAVKTLCPIIQAGLSKSAINDTRHDCAESPMEIQGRAKSHFAWALAHLGEAIAFYSVVLYDDGAVDSKGARLGPNIQRVSGSLDPKNVSTFLEGLQVLTTVINQIFPTDATAAADSMLNAMFNDLSVTSLAFTEMGGVPESVTKSLNASIDNLKAKVAKVSTTTDSSATSEAAKENAAIRNALTTGVAAKLDTKIKELSGEDKVKACALYQQINSDPAKKPTGC